MTTYPNQEPATIYTEQRATLGCGTLILIALIVLIFSNAGTDEIRQDLRHVKRELENVKTAVGQQNTEIDSLRKAIEKLTKAKGETPGSSPDGRR